MGAVDDAIRSMRVLLVEDEQDIRELLASQFAHRGFEAFETIGTAAEARGRIDQSPPDLVMLDLVLPDESGLDLLDDLVNTRNLPVIVVTCKDDKATQMHALEIGAAEYVVKPFDTDLLMLKVEKLLTTIHLQEHLEGSRRHNQRLFLNILQVMAKTLEARDPYTRYHSESVARYARMIGRRMGLEDDQIELLQIAGILHDFGKIGLKEGLLNKPGALEPEEYEIVKRHPLVASAILEPIEELESVISFIRHHHEFYDGGGYPDGIAGEDIPLGARILMVADAFDAMMSERSYRRPKTRDEAIRELESCSGRQFDPRVVEAMLEALDGERSREGTDKGVLRSAAADAAAEEGDPE